MKFTPGTDEASGIICVVAVELDSVYKPPVVMIEDVTTALTFSFAGADKAESICKLSEPDSIFMPKTGDIVTFMSETP
jgi:hypothetical protein